ncbi:MAG: HAD family hydrolase [Alphaproteobacteria bacterium]|nr:HAD family hydrolase [Alphaproteobacteria bacterium]
MHLPKAIFFDWDGTLVDSYSFLNDAHNHTMKELGFEPMKEGEYKKYFGKPRETLYPILYGDKGEDAKIVFGEYVLNNAHKIKPLSGAIELVEAVDQMDIPMGVVSNKKSEFLKKEAEHLGWLEYFTIFVGAGDAAHDKPSDAPLRLAVEESGLQTTAPQDIWFVGDTENDILCAKNFGCKAVLIIEGSEHNSLSIATHPDVTAENCDELKRILFQIDS